MSDLTSAASRRQPSIRTALTRLFAGAVCAGMLLISTPTLAQRNAERITPNFKDADITQIIEAVSMATGKNFIIDPRVRGQVTMLSSTPMTPGQFYQAFLAILQVHGYVALPAGDVIKVVPDANMRQMPGDDLPSRISSSSDEVVTQVVAVKNVSATQLVPVLRPLMPQNAQLSSVTGSNMLIISDRAGNVERIMRIIERIDQVGNSDIDVIQLQSATAADTVRVLNSLISQAGENGMAVKVVADDRSNSILISGDAGQRLRLKALIAHLDTPVDTGSQTQVRYLRYADAEDLASKLKEQLSGGGGGGSSSSGSGITNQDRISPAQPQPNAQGSTGPLPAASARTTPTGGAATISLAGGTATIWADKDTNALVITASQRTMRAVNAVIDKLDIRRAQVLVQAIIAEVTSDKVEDLGVNWAVDGSANSVGVGGFVSPVGSSSIVDLYSDYASSTYTDAALSGTTIGIGKLTASGVNFAAMLRALQTDTRTNILSTPSIVTRDNQEAKMEVGQEVPFLTGQYTTTSGTSSAFQTIEREDVGTILTVTPQINEGDAVLLKLQIESSSIAPSSDGAVDVITNKRTITTSVLVKDGGTLVLGGLISDSATNADAGVPLLSKIPFLGELFRTRNTEKTKSDLLIFLQPKILRTDAQAALETDSKYDFVQTESQINGHDTVKLPLLHYADPPAYPEINGRSLPVVPGTTKDSGSSTGIDFGTRKSGSPAAPGDTTGSANGTGSAGSGTTAGTSAGPGAASGTDTGTAGSAP